VAERPIVDDDFLLRRFIGPNADHYIVIYNTARAKNPDQPFGAMRSWSWPAALWFLPWALYRKMWLFGGSVTIAGIILSLLFPSAATAMGIGLAVATGFISNRIYLQLVVRKIAKLKAISDSEGDLLARLDRAGDVSSFGAWFGVVVLVCASLIAAVTGYNAALNQH
jgi:hypothetical protein